MPFPDPGIYTDVSQDAYHRDLTAISSSTLRMFQVSPRAFCDRQIRGRWYPRTSKALEFGTMLHEYLLVGTDNLAVPPKEVLSKSGSRAGKSYHAWAAENAGKQIMTARELDEVKEAASVVLDDPLARKLLRDVRGQNEVSHVARDSATGLCIKARPDRLVDEPSVCEDLLLVDLKTTTDSRPAKFAKSVGSYGYHIQAAFYGRVVEQTMPGRKVAGMVFVAVQSTPPYDTRLCELHTDDMERAGQEVESTLWQIKERMLADDWQLDERGTSTIVRVPEWAFETTSRVW